MTCIGCITAYITVIIYGIPVTDKLCNAREWLVAISFTLVFMPLFAKTYRISAIFNNILKLRQTDIKDYHLIMGVLACVFIDIIFLAYLP